MTKPHKHAAVIIAWATGGDIQWRFTDTSEWHDLVSPSPAWDEMLKYRVKPFAPDLHINEWEASSYIDESDSGVHGAYINLPYHAAAIAVYRDTKEEAEYLRDYVLNAVKAYKEASQ